MKAKNPREEISQIANLGFLSGNASLQGPKEETSHIFLDLLDDCLYSAQHQLRAQLYWETDI